MTYRNLTLSELAVLEEHGCHSNNWEAVWVADDFLANNIYNVRFDGEVRIGSNVRLANIGIIRTTDGASFGQGVTVSVKNEAGDGNVILYSDLSAQMAALMISRSEDKALFGKEPKVRAIHAGLECGLFSEKYPHMDMISFGPTLRGVHSPDECLHIPTVDMVWRHMVAILEEAPSE